MVPVGDWPDLSTTKFRPLFALVFMLPAQTRHVTNKIYWFWSRMRPAMAVLACPTTTLLNLSLHSLSYSDYALWLISLLFPLSEISHLLSVTERWWRFPDWNWLKMIQTKTVTKIACGNRPFKLLDIHSRSCLWSKQSPVKVLYRILQYH